MEKYGNIYIKEAESGKKCNSFKKQRYLQRKKIEKQ